MIHGHSLVNGTTVEEETDFLVLIMIITRLWYSSIGRTRDQITVTKDEIYILQFNLLPWKRVYIYFCPPTSFDH